MRSENFHFDNVYKFEEFIQGLKPDFKCFTENAKNSAQQLIDEHENLNVKSFQKWFAKNCGGVSVKIKLLYWTMKGHSEDNEGSQ